MNQQLRGNVLVMGETAATGTPDHHQTHHRRHQCGQQQHQHQRHADCHHNSTNKTNNGNATGLLGLVLPAEKDATIATAQMQRTAVAVPAALTSLLLGTAAQHQSPGTSVPLTGSSSSNNDSWAATETSSCLSLLLKQRGNNIGPTSPSAAPAAFSTASTTATASASTSILGSRQDARITNFTSKSSSKHDDDDVGIIATVMATTPTFLPTQTRAQQQADTLPLPHPRQTAMTSPRTAATFMDACDTGTGITIAATATTSSKQTRKVPAKGFKRHRVQFDVNPPAIISFIQLDHGDDESKKISLWYARSELSTFRKVAFVSALLASKNSGDSANANTSANNDILTENATTHPAPPLTIDTSGLERYSRERSHMKGLARKCIMQAQRRYKEQQQQQESMTGATTTATINGKQEESIPMDDFLAQISIECTSWAQEVAFEQGLNDYIAAYGHPPCYHTCAPRGDAGSSNRSGPDGSSILQNNGQFGNPHHSINASSSNQTSSHNTDHTAPSLALQYAMGIVKSNQCIDGPQQQRQQVQSSSLLQTSFQSLYAPSVNNLQQRTTAATGKRKRGLATIMDFPTATTKTAKTT